MIELQEIIRKKSREQSEMKDRLAALSAHITELEKDLDTARKDLQLCYVGREGCQAVLHLSLLP